MKKPLIDITFKMYLDANGGDPDSTSPTLRYYHKLLWSKKLSNGKLFDLTDRKSGVYLYHNSELGEFSLGSDSITHSYRNQKSKQWLVSQIPSQVDELFEVGSTIGANILFPRNQVNKKNTINQARGVNPLIDDRFDLTLECIRLFYLQEESPLFETFLRYKNFFNLFETFEGYVNFFLLDDLLDDKKQVKFYFPFDNFKTKPVFNSADDYLSYKEKVTRFVVSRNERIKKYSETLTS
jgi:hypothetical protein